jgi:hypothetical protein
LAEQQGLEQETMGAVMATDKWVCGLKAIGAALGVTGRTVQRWIAAETYNLPVRRFRGRWRARAADLEMWKGD